MLHVKHLPRKVNQVQKYQRSDVPMETHRRSLVKCLVWRGIAFLILLMITYIVTMEMKLSLGVSSITHTLKLGVHYIYERLWDRSDYERLVRLDRKTY